MLKIICLLVALVPLFKDYKSLNHQAEQEYQKPIRPGYEGRNPYWNVFAKKFIYAPAFDFKNVDGAVKYRFSISMQDADESVSSQKKNSSNSWTFVANTPQASLAPVWKKLPVGNMKLMVEGIDKEGKVVGTAGERTFLRDFPFNGPYSPAVRPYETAARMALLYIHQMPAVQHWIEHIEPDMSYQLNTYPNKIIGATVRAEVHIARLFPELRKEATEIARHAAQFLIDKSCKEGERLEGFPPTYYGGLITSKMYEGLIMTMDPCMAANAFLDLYEYTKESLYQERAYKILDTYAKLQKPDGSLPIKLVVATGEAVNSGKAMLNDMMQLIRRVQDSYQMHKYDELLSKAEKWMREVALETFDLTGQFEDASVDVVAYQNLTNCTAAPYATYLLSLPQPSKKDIQDARDLIALCEDQFVHWDGLPTEFGLKNLPGPCVNEQYFYETAVDHSSCVVANALMSLYEVTGDKLALAKAVSLMNTLTITQNSLNGYVPTLVEYVKLSGAFDRSFWMNCGMATITTWLRLAELLNGK